MIFFDITSFLEANNDNHKYLQLSKLARQAASMSSIRNDIVKANGLIEYSKKLHARLRESSNGKPVEGDEPLIAHAIFVDALLLYTRATHSQSRARNKLDVFKSFDTETLEYYRCLTQLRDNFFAHYSKPAGWEHDRVVYALDAANERAALSFPHEAYYVKADDAQKLEAVLAAATLVIDKRYDHAARKLSDEIVRISEAVPTFAKQLNIHRFIPEHFFAEDEVEGFISTIGGQKHFNPLPKVKFQRRS